VKRITATEMLDKLDNAVPEGLYDPAMGPTDPKGAATARRAQPPPPPPSNWTLRPPAPLLPATAAAPHR
jgi:hypothetical protein